jgi:hypothetical protein
MALAALGLPEAPVHDPVHAERQHRPATVTERSDRDLAAAMPRLDAIPASLVGEHPGQHGGITPRPRLESGKRGADRLAQAAADTDLVTLGLRIAQTGHIVTTPKAAHPPVVGQGDNTACHDAGQATSVGARAVGPGEQ